MKDLDVSGLVLTETRISDTKKYIRILTDTAGKMSVIVHGATGMRSKYLAAVKPYSYSTFTLTEKHGSYTLKEAELKQSFFKVSSDVQSLALASYIVSVADYVSNEDDDCTELLSLTLNSLYAICEKLRKYEIIKAVFELKCASVLGFSPSLIACSVCKNDITKVKSFIRIYDGNAICENCKSKTSSIDGREYEITFPLTNSQIAAIRYIEITEIKKMYSFSLPDNEVTEFSQLCESYLSAHIEKGFAALKIYKMLTQ